MSFKALEMFLLFIVVFGAFLWFFVAVDRNPIAWLGKEFGVGWEKGIYFIISASALFFLFSRDYYLSFLGESVYPCNSLLEKIPYEADTTVQIHTVPNSNVVYWAAESGSKVKDTPWLAYSKYENAGVTVSDENGLAILKVRNPASYRVPMKGQLQPHIHYRTCIGPGMLSRVETVFL